MQSIGVVFSKNGDIYDYLNKYNLTIEIGDFVEVKVGTGGTKIVEVVDIDNDFDPADYGKKKSFYKPVLEVIEGFGEAPEYSDKVLDKYEPICLTRVERKQYDNEIGEYIITWSDIIIEYKYFDGDKIEIGDVFEVLYKDEETKARIVGFSKIKKGSAKEKNIDYLGEKIEEVKDFPTKFSGEESFVASKVETKNKNELSPEIKTETKSNNPEKIKFFKTKWFVILSYIAFWPLGIFLGLKYKVFNKKIHIGMGIAILLMMFLGD